MAGGLMSEISEKRQTTSSRSAKPTGGLGGLTWKNEHGQYVGDSESPASSTVVSALLIREQKNDRADKPVH